jgi:cytoskeletal protein CcmA (bactofilin family)
MFKRKLSADSFTNLIAKGTKIAGDVKFDGALKVEGNIDGNISHNSADLSVDNALNVTKDGGIIGNFIHSPNAILGGNILVNEIRVEGTLRILSDAHIKGAKILYRSLEIEHGAILDNCQMQHLDWTSEGEVI